MATARAKGKPRIEVSGKAKDKIEPSKVVVLPDVAIRGTDSDNMQIKELKSQKSHGIWLAVHIPDNGTSPLRPVKILSTKKAAEDLEKIVGPNRATMFKELQSIIGVDSTTLRKMLKAGQIDGRRHRKIHKIKEEDDEEEEDEDSDGESDDDDNEEEAKEDEEEDDSGEDTKCQDDEDEDEEQSEEEEEEDVDEEEDDDKQGRKHKNKQNQGKLKTQSKQMDKEINKPNKKPKYGKKCSGNKMLPWTLNNDGGSGVETNSSNVLQPEGHEAPLANMLNKIHFRLKRKRACKHPKNPIIQELCKQMDRHHKNPRPNWNQPRRHLHFSHKKYYRHLKRLMRKFLNRHSGRQAHQILQYMNLLLSDQLRLSPDGIVHLYPNRNGKANNYGDGFKALANDNSGTRDSNTPPLEPPTIDENMYNNNLIRVPVPGSTRGTTAPNVGIMSNSQANVLNNQVHTKLGDPHSSEGDTQMQMLKEELGRANEELKEQQNEKARDDAIMDKYMFNFQSLAEKGPIHAFDGMQKDAEERVNGQKVSVIDPNQISLKESRLPIRNRLDIPSLGGYIGNQFTGFTRRNRIQNYLKSIAKRVQNQQKEKPRKKTEEHPSNVKRH